MLAFMKSFFFIILLLTITDVLTFRYSLKFKILFPFQQTSLNSKLYCSPVSEEKQSKIKLPIVQIYQKGQLKAEVINSDGVSAMLDKFVSTLKSIESDIQNIRDSNAAPKFIGSIYDENQLLDEIKMYEITIFKLFRDGCKKCAEFDSHYDNLSIAYPSIRWLQGNVDYIPQYVQSLKNRLLGLSDANKVENCDRCQNTGFILCDECFGNGVVSRGDIKVTCPRCVGYKKVRCPKCGGSCPKCNPENIKSITNN